ncbi:MAG: hypothetical protein A3J37_08325 [Alphaproteobacteria bacterium RIFCSPHIGHO2_12_FULL_45_9]|nr:MAG: hypothetical protein A3B66_10670 [Alphaproteobacteria bacterium RIFCSPHIGHO2_02_FULL_46_13]OFW95269.1 MAG: hypothetical protein A3J37_08325 [Alphaproteobacteria bacterium RIFCSPHIGHO2_12_FULL_45_9]
MLKISKLVALIFFVMALYVAPAFAATSIPFTITMSKAVNVTGTPRIALDVGGIAPPRYATYSSGSGTATLTFTYTMVAGDVDLDGISLTATIDLNGGAIKDLAGNDLTPLTFTTPNTTNVKVNYPSLGMDFIYDADGRYTLNGTVYNDLTSFLTAASGTFTRASVGTYFDSTGTLQTAASGVPRFDFDPTTHAAKGILIEESKNNVVKYSEQLEQANWGKAYTNISSNVTPSPDGNMTADRFSADGSNNSHFLFIYNIFSSGSDYAVSFFVKKDTANFVLASVTGSSYVNVRLDLNTGTKTTTTSGGSTLYNSTIQSLPNGWYWVRFAFRQTSGQTQDLRIYVYNATNPEASTASAFLWGAQIEQGIFSTSYIPTTTATVTRAADVLTVPTGSWTDAAKGTLLGIAQQNSLISTHPTYIATVGNNSSSDFAALFLNAASGKSAVVNTSGVDQYNQLLGTYVAGNTTKIALAYQANDFRAAMDGSFATATSSGTIPSVSVLRIGDRDGTRTLNGTVQMFKYYPARVPNTQLQLMTQ